MTEQIEKITNEWQNKIKQVKGERLIKQDTYIKSKQADDGTRRQIKQTGKNQRQTWSEQRKQATKKKCIVRAVRW